MASSSDRDKETKDSSQSQPSNPFIKFRQFADSQISSLLQGVIGLPSAFTKNPHNARWADFDDDMKRRDELQKKKNGLRESEARVQEEGRGLRGAEDSRRDMDMDVDADDADMDAERARDIPLYSPVSKSLFAHIRDAREDVGLRDDWKPVDPQYPVSFTPSFYETFRASRGGYMTPLKALRRIVYRDLNLNPILRSDYSLLPYLLFSPYSPFQLRYEEDELRWKKNHYVEEFPYFEAFEDLILTTQGRPMDSLPQRYLDVFPVVELERGWIYSLWAHGLLQQRSTTPHLDVFKFQSKLMGNIDSLLESMRSRLEEAQSDDDAQTEQELYERFLRRASSSVGIADILESLFADAEGWINKSLASLDPSEMKRQLKEFTDFLEQKTGNDAEDERRAQAAKLLASLFAQATGLFEGRRSSATEGKEKGQLPDENFAETKIGKELKALKSKAATDPNKPVFTSTMTEHTTNEDGSVEHSVTVWKRYADGRETKTTTSHTEELGDRAADAHWPEREREQTANEERLVDQRDGKWKGWFWN